METNSNSSQVPSGILVPDLQPTFDTGVIEGDDFSDLFIDKIDPTDNFDDIFARPDAVESIVVDCDESQWIGQWNRLIHLHKTTTNSAVRTQLDRFSREFITSLEFRGHFHKEIERKCWDHIDVMNHQAGTENMRKARAIVSSLLNEISATLSNTPNMQFELSSRLGEWRMKLQDHYFYHPMELVQLILRMFSRERDILYFANNQLVASPSPHGVNGVGGMHVNNQPSAHPDLIQTQRARIQTIMGEISEIEQQVRKTTSLVDQMTAEYEDLQCRTSGNIHILASPQTLSQSQNQGNKSLIESLAKRYAHLGRVKEETVVNSHVNIFSSALPRLVDRIIDEIAVWKRAEAYAANGKVLSNATVVDQLEDCCKPVGQFLNICLEQVVKLGRLQLSPVEAIHQQLNELQQNYELAIKKFVKYTLVVEKQPPQVLMKDKKFVCQLRHLMGQQMRFETKVWLINTEEADAILKGDESKNITTSGKIINNSAKSDYSEQTRQVFVHMRNMSLQMRQRGDRGRADCVAEEKFCMIFRADISLRLTMNTESTVTAQTMSLPIVVISHGKQEADAQATIFWDNAFSQLNRVPFVVPDSTRWDIFLDELHWFWKKNCRDTGGSQREGFGLDEEAKRYLTIKLLGRDDRKATVQLRQINRDNLPKQTFTFWTWLYKILELVSSPYVKKYWNSQLIRGFISKDDCKEILPSCALGTFLFRFSDSILGAISIACFTIDVSKEHEEVGHLEPDTIQKLRTRSLPDMVKDIQYLHCLYPHRPKDDVFGEYYTKPVAPTEGDSGYWRKDIRIRTVNDVDNIDSSGSRTPHHPSSSSMRNHQHPFSPTGSSYSDARSSFEDSME